MEELPLLLYILFDMIHVKTIASAYGINQLKYTGADRDYNTTGGLSCAFI